MNTKTISLTIEKVSKLIKHQFNPFEFNKYIKNDDKESNDLLQIVDQMLEMANSVQLVLFQHFTNPTQFKESIDNFDFPFIVFLRDKATIFPALIHRGLRNKQVITIIKYDIVTTRELEPSDFGKFLTQSEFGNKYDNQIVFLTPVSMISLVSENRLREDYNEHELTPYRRLLRILNTERKEISYIYVYAITVGIISLSLPLGIQAIINMISGGMIFSSVILLITLVIIGTLISGGLQIMQISMVEIIQRRIFVKAAFEFAYRITKIKLEVIFKEYPPELMNRFFDVITIQKGLPKLLIELTSASLQIIFGVILLSFYHSFFVFFGILLFTLLFVALYTTSPKGLETNNYESKYKYKIAHWLEELARTLVPFKLAGFTNLPLEKMDYYLNNYLKSRKAHFKVLMTQYSFIIIFKTLVTGGVLIMGSVLVTNKEISLGQFVASEIVIVLIINAVEKLITSMDTVYDILTAVEKIGSVTDLPLEKEQGAVLPRSNSEVGLILDIKKLKYKYPEANDYTLENITFKVNSGERIGICGEANSGKFTLLQVIAGLYHNYEGIVTLDGLSLRDIDINSIRDNVGQYASHEDIFDGTILENITMGVPRTNIKDVIWAIDKVHLSDYVNTLPDGLNTQLIAGGKGVNSTVIKKIVLARAIAEKPRLLLLHKFLNTLSKDDKMILLDFLFNTENKWTLVCISNDPEVLSKCDKIIFIKDGIVEQQGKYNELIKNKSFDSLVNHFQA